MFNKIYIILVTFLWISGGKFSVSRKNGSVLFVSVFDFRDNFCAKFILLPTALADISSIRSVITTESAFADV